MDKERIEERGREERKLRGERGRGEGRDELEGMSLVFTPPRLLGVLTAADRPKVASNWSIRGETASFRWAG